MKQKLMIVAGVLLFAMNLQASLIEFKLHGVETDTGAGTQNHYSLAGTAIYDTVSSNMTYVTYLANKTYTVYSVTNYQSLIVRGPGNGRKNLVLTISTSETDTNGYYHSMNELLTGTVGNVHVGHNNNVQFATKITSTSSSLAPDDLGNEWLYAWSETLQYDGSRTEDDNNGGLDVQQVVNAITVALREKGYTSAN